MKQLASGSKKKQNESAKLDFSDLFGELGGVKGLHDFVKQTMNDCDDEELLFRFEAALFSQFGPPEIDGKQNRGRTKAISEHLGFLSSIAIRMK